jgi:hypothetical protein
MNRATRVSIVCDEVKVGRGTSTKPGITPPGQHRTRLRQNLGPLSFPVVLVLRAEID